jgi:hypothetical protein
MALAIDTGLFYDALRALAERMDAAHDAHAASRAVDIVWARGDTTTIDDREASR